MKILILSAILYFSLLSPLAFAQESQAQATQSPPPQQQESIGFKPSSSSDYSDVNGFDPGPPMDQNKDEETHRERVPAGNENMPVDQD